MKKQIPYIPKQSTDFRSMQYIYCESEPNSKLVTRATFLRLLEQQPCPMAQVNIDLEGGYYAFRVFHAGMATPVPVANGGTGASTAKAALNNLGIFYSATLPSSGTDGQICLVPV